MKKSFAVTIAVVLLVSIFCTTAYAEDSGKAVDFMKLNAESKDVTVGSVRISDSENTSVSGPMTLSEIAQVYARNNEVSLDTAMELFSTEGLIGMDSVSSTQRTYRVLSVNINVESEDGDETFSPRIDFYCETSESGNYWGILNVYDMELVRRDSSGKTKQFSGDLKMWLRSAYEIEFVINGDFYNNGTTTKTVGFGLSIGIGDSASVSFQASSTTSSNHFAYCYISRLVAFQS